jgi:hypothetical protein
MRSSGLRDAWLRMTDALNLTEPGKKPVPPNPRLLLFGAVLWSVSALIWFRMAFLSEGEMWFASMVLIVLSLVLAVMNLVQWRRSKKKTDGPTGNQT